MSNMQLTQFLYVIYLFGVGQCKMLPYVVDGLNAKILNFPYCAFLHIKCVEKDGDEYSYMCGSSIINQYLVLTAAHCTNGCDVSTEITVSVGSEIKSSGAASTAHSFYNHKEFDPRTVENDISLVRLKTPLKFSSSVSRVALMKHPPYDEEALVAGWGQNDEENHKYPNALQYTTQYVKDKETCASLLKKKHAKDGTFCAGNRDGYPSKGDSGSALVVRHYIQIGIVSYKLKHPNDDNRKVVVYTDTGHYLPWIKKSSEKLMCSH